MTVKIVCVIIITFIIADEFMLDFVDHMTNVTPFGDLCWASSSSFGIHSSADRSRTKTSYGDRSFSVHGPSVWNSLQNDLRLSDSGHVIRNI